MDEVAAAYDGTIAVGRLAGLIPAGVDHGVQISGKIIGKNIVFHDTSNNTV